MASHATSQGSTSGLLAASSSAFIVSCEPCSAGVGIALILLRFGRASNPVAESITQLSQCLVHAAACGLLGAAKRDRDLRITYLQVFALHQGNALFRWEGFDEALDLT